MIDAVGGVTVDNPKAINDPRYDWLDGTSGFYLDAGKVHLNGRKALAYVRSRQGIGDTDFTRAARQQQVLVALRNKLDLARHAHPAAGDHQRGGRHRPDEPAHASGWTSSSRSRREVDTEAIKRVRPRVRRTPTTRPRAAPAASGRSQLQDEQGQGAVQGAVRRRQPLRQRAMLRHHPATGALAPSSPADGVVAVAALRWRSPVLRLGDAWQEAWLAAGAPWWRVGAGLRRDCGRSPSGSTSWTSSGHAGRSAARCMDIVRAVLIRGGRRLQPAVPRPRPGGEPAVPARPVHSSSWWSPSPSAVTYRVLLAGARRKQVGTPQRGRPGHEPRGDRESPGASSSHPVLGYRVIGFMGTPTASCPVVLGPLRRHRVRRPPGRRRRARGRVRPGRARLPRARRRRSRTRRASGSASCSSPACRPISGGRIERLGDLEIATVSNGPDRVLGLAAKRLLDIVLIAALVLVVLAPIFAVIAVAIWLEDRGPVLLPADARRPPRPPVPDRQVPVHGP